MQVSLSFDTEQERVENLKKLVEALEQLIAHREGRNYQPKQSPVVSTPAEAKVNDKTVGGCRVIPYEDMSGRMSQLFSGRRI